MKKLEKPNWKKRREVQRFRWIAGAGVFVLAIAGLSAVYLLNKAFAGSFSSPGDAHLAEPEIQGNRIFVRKGDSFQIALNRAKSGDTILLQEGVIFKGAFKLPKKKGNEFITIRTSTKDINLPLPGKRIDPKKYAGNLPKLESNVKGESVIATQNGAHHFRFIGIEFMPTIEGLYDIVQVGTGDETKSEDVPHHIEFDRVYIHGSETEGQRRGIAANGRHIRITNSHISNIKRKGDESQAIASWATDGPIEIINNYLEAAGMSILFGGASSPLKLIPSNCIVRDNHMNKPLKWLGTEWVVKNMFEIKSGSNIKVQNNLMTHNWTMGQTGTAVLFTTRKDNDNVVIENIEFSGNIVRGSGNALNIYGSEGNGGKNLVIRNNLFDDIGGSKWNGSGHFMIVSDWDGLTIENNTVIQTGNITNAHTNPTKNFIFRNNIIFQNEYGFIGDGTSPGRDTLSKYFRQVNISNNIIVGSDASMYGRQNFYPSSIRQIGFENFKDYRLRKKSPYRNKGSDGKRIGADLDPSLVGGD